LQLPREKIAERAVASSAQLNARIKYVQDMILLKNYFDTCQFRDSTSLAEFLFASENSVSTYSTFMRCV
uniref:Growth hormone n=1 Tax=Echinostoma caproni TaxID=27848 RepID=A0A183B6G1_9TREM